LGEFAEGVELLFRSWAASGVSLGDFETLFMGGDYTAGGGEMGGEGRG